MKKQWIVMLAVSAVFVFQNCKGKNETAEEKQKHPDHHEVEHYYGVYRDEIRQSSRTTSSTDTIYKHVKFGNSEVKYVINSKNESYFNSDKDKDVYKVVIGQGDTIITPINETLKNNKYLFPSLIDNSKALLGRGNLGCIPKFEANYAGSVQHTIDPNSPDIYIVPIYLANHHPFPEDSIIRLLSLEYFRMTESQYQELDSLYHVNSNIEGGLNSIPNSTIRHLIIFDGVIPKQIILESN